VARPWWANFSIRVGHPILERIWDSLAENGAGDPHAGRRFYQMLASLVPATADSAFRGDTSQFLTVSPAPLTAGQIPDTPAGAQGEVHLAPTPAIVVTPADDLLVGDTEDGGTAVIGDAGLGMVGVLVDWPWPIALGLTPLTADWDSLAGREPNGWLEALLAQSALASPALIEFGAHELAGAANNPPFWADVARSGLALSGDFSAGFMLTATPFDVDRITLDAGYDYNLAVGDDLVAAGGRLVIDAGALGEGAHVLFDGSAERDGSFAFFGGDSNDVFIGGSGSDWIRGGGGADTLNGGGGSDTFVYGTPADSTSTGYDTLVGFAAGTDHIDLPGTVSGFAAPITSGSLSTASFDADLGAALGGLGATRAAWFAPDAGDLAGSIFLIVDANSVAGYQPGEDYVFAVAGTPLADLTGHTDIFI